MQNTLTYILYVKTTESYTLDGHCYVVHIILLALADRYNVCIITNICHWILYLYVYWFDIV